MTTLLEPDVATKRHQVIERGQQIYDTVVKPKLEPTDAGRFVAIEPTTGRYFLADTAAKALLAARLAMPDNSFYLARVGHRAAHTIGGHASRIR